MHIHTHTATQSTQEDDEEDDQYSTPRPLPLPTPGQIDLSALQLSHPLLNPELLRKLQKVARRRSTSQAQRQAIATLLALYLEQVSSPVSSPVESEREEEQQGGTATAARYGTRRYCNTGSTVGPVYNVQCVCSRRHCIVDVIVYCTGSPPQLLAEINYIATS